jgi:tetratricopeptide (TPR) repeat protein
MVECRPLETGVPAIALGKKSALAAIAASLASSAYFGCSQYTQHEAAARRADFLKRSSDANALVAQGKFQAAIPALKAALDAAPPGMSADRLTLCNNLAGAYTATGKSAEAEDLLNETRKEVELLPETVINTPEFRRERVRLLTGIANVLLAQGKLADAESLYRRAVELGPEDGAAHSNLANVLSLQQKYAEADAHFDMAVARQPNNPETLCNWGIMLLNDKRPREAEQKFRSALALNAHAAKYYYGLGLALRAQSRYGPALQTQQTAVHYDPKMVDAFLEIADIYVQVKDYKQAEIYLRAALSEKVDPNNLHAIQALARLLAGTTDPDQRNYFESANLYQRAVELTRGQDVNLLTQLADIYALLNVWDRAGETIDLAIQRAKEQKLSAVDIETLMQHAQQYAIMQFDPVRSPETPNEFASVAEAFGMKPKTTDPYDAPQPAPKHFSPKALVTPP